MQGRIEHYRTEGYVMTSSDAPSGSCLTFWMLARNLDGTVDVLRKDIHASCNIRIGIAYGLDEREAIGLIHDIERDAEQSGQKVVRNMLEYIRLLKDEMFAGAKPMEQHSGSIAAKRLESMKKNKPKKPSLKF